MDVEARDGCVGVSDREESKADKSSSGCSVGVGELSDCPFVVDEEEPMPLLESSKKGDGNVVLTNAPGLPLPSPPTASNSLSFPLPGTDDPFGLPATILPFPVFRLFPNSPDSSFCNKASVFGVRRHLGMSSGSSVHFRTGARGRVEYLGFFCSEEGELWSGFQNSGEERRERVGSVIGCCCWCCWCWEEADDEDGQGRPSLSAWMFGRRAMGAVAVVEVVDVDGGFVGGLRDARRALRAEFSWCVNGKVLLGERESTRD